MSILLLAGCSAPDTASGPPAAGPIDAPQQADDVTMPQPPGTQAPPPRPWTDHRLSGVEGYNAETTLAFDAEGTLFMMAWAKTLRSEDQGFTWSIVHDFQLRSAAPESGSLTTTGDPMMWYDVVTDTLYVSHLYAGCSTLLKSVDKGETWDRRDGACLTPVLDFQKLAGGKPGPISNPLAGALSPTVLYMCYNKVASANCITSYDGGDTWPVERVVARRMEPCASVLGGHLAVSAKSGIAAYPLTDGCPRPIVLVAEDSGLTWTPRPAPDTVGAQGFGADVAWSSEDALYLVWRDENYLPVMARSVDAGRTWAGPWRVAPASVSSVAFVTVSAGSDGRVAVAYVGTRDHEGDPGRAADTTRWHLFISTSDDGGSTAPTFKHYQVTPEADPVHVGCTPEAKPITDPTARTCPSRRLGDFIDSAIAPSGELFVAYGETCTNRCAGNNNATLEDSQDAQVAIATLNGWTLRAPRSDR